MAALPKALALSLGIALCACAPSHQPEPEQPEPAPEVVTVSEPERTEGLARTPVPPLQNQVPAPHRPDPEPPTQPAPVETAPATQSLPTAYQAMLDRHNQHRADHCAAPLKWSSKLQKLAQAWADKLEAAGCAFEHSRGNPYGENLSFFAPRGSRTPQEVATGWYSEVSQYDFSRGGFDFNTGHFTQLVWRSTSKLGCGVSQCNGGEIWVCNYDPPGNMMGAFQSNVQPTSCR